MIRYLEISARQTGKTARLVAAVRSVMNNVSQNYRIGIMSFNNQAINNIKSRFNYEERLKIHFFTKFDNIRGIKFHSIFVDEFDHVNLDEMNEIISLSEIDNIDLYLYTTPRFVRSTAEMSNVLDPLVWTLNNNNNRYIYHSNSQLDTGIHISETGIFRSSEELLNDFQDSTPQTFISAALVSTMNDSNIIDTASFLNMIGGDQEYVPLRIGRPAPPPQFPASSNNQIQEMIEREVQKRLQQLTSKCDTEIGKSIGNRKIEL